MNKVKKLIAVLFCAMALVAACAGIFLALDSMDSEPVLVREDPQARQTAQALLDAVSAGDYELAARYLLGRPTLGVDRQAQDVVGVMLWEAYQESLRFTPAGDCYTTATGVAYDYTVRYLDLDSVTAALRHRSQSLLSQRVEEADDMSQVYDENNEYRESFVMAVLHAAAQQALREDAVYIEEIFTVSMVYRDGTWWAISDDGLLRAISGGLAG